MWLFRSAFVFIAYTAIVIYTGIRVLTLIKLKRPSLKAFVFWPVYIILAFSYVIFTLLRFERVWPLHQAAMYSLPFFAYLFLGLVIFEIARLVFLFKKKRRFSPNVSALMTGIALIIAVLAMVYGTLNARYIRTVNYEVVIDKPVKFNQGAALRIALITDLHIGRTVDHKWVSKIVDAVNKAKPDLICVAGDIFDNSIEMSGDPEGMARQLRRFSAPLGVYACQGNHDIDRLSLRQESSGDRIQEFLKTAGVNYLLDEVVLIADAFYLAGRKDYRLIGSTQIRKTALELTAALDKELPIIFMDHQPVDYARLEEAGADLILSGHTHGGQFFPGNIITAMLYKKAGAVHYGHWKGGTAHGVISSGAGLWGPPIRIGSKSEVVIVDIMNGK